MKQQMPVYYISATSRFKADSETVLKQLNKSIANHLTKYSTTYKTQFDTLERESHERLAGLRELAEPREDGALSSAFVAKKLKGMMPEDSVVCLEAVTQTGKQLCTLFYNINSLTEAIVAVTHQLQMTVPGTLL